MGCVNGVVAAGASVRRCSATPIKAGSASRGVREGVWDRRVAPQWCVLRLGENLARLRERMSAGVTLLETCVCVFDMFVPNCGGHLAGRYFCFLSRSTLGSFCFLYYSCH